MRKESDVSPKSFQGPIYRRRRSRITVVVRWARGAEKETYNNSSRACSAVAVNSEDSIVVSSS